MEAELICVDNFPSHLGPLDVFMSKSHLDSVFQRDTYLPTVLLHPQRPSGPGSTSLLLRVHPTEDGPASCESQDPGRGSGPPVQLLASRLLLQRAGSRGSVRAVVPVPVQKVVLGARSLRRTGTQQLLSGLLELCRPGQELLVRQGEKLFLPGAPGQELLVLECSPVTQGMITGHTSIILTELSDSVSSYALPSNCRLLSLCVSDFALCADNLIREGSLLDKSQVLGSRFSGALQGLECRIELKVLETQQWLSLAGVQNGTVDRDSSVFVSKRLLLRLGLFNQEWVRLLWPGEACKANAVDSPAVRERLVSLQVVDLPSDLQTHQDLGFISATLWFNMTDGEVIPLNSCTLRMKRWNPSCEQPDGRSSVSVCGRASPLRATEIHIQPVASPLVHNPSCCDQLLAQHFSTPRLVAEGDILSVPARNHPDLLENNCEGILRCPVLFFRVQKVCHSAEEGGGRGRFLLVDRIHSSLYMGSPVNTTVPCCSGEEVTLKSVLIPFGLSRTVEILSRIILPYLQHSSLSGCTVLLHAPPNSGKMTAVRAVCSRLNLHLLKVDCVSLCADTPAASEVKLSSVFQRADSLQPCILLLRNLQLLFSARGASEDTRVAGTLCRLLHSAPRSVVVVTTVRRPQDLPAGVMAAFVHQVEVESPTEEDRHSLLVSLSQELQLGLNVNLRKLSKLTAGMALGDLRALVVEAGRAACRRLTHTCDAQQQEDLCSSGVTILNQDFLLALETLQQTQAKAIGGPKIPNVHWEDVGGQHDVKKEILDTVELPLQHPELMSLGLIRTGVLLYGPPGTGKTLLAKAVATECSMTFISVKGPELINMYIGQSEENIREVFIKARSAAPCVVFFDELDSLAPNRGRSGDSGGVMDRVVSQLLAELDSLHSCAGVFVIGATNRPDLLDQSLLRPGRFDKLVYVGIKDSRISQLQVLQAILRKFELDSDVNLQELVNSFPARMTGADLYALCSDAMTASIKRNISLINKGVASEDSPVRLSLQDFLSALESFRPSVSDQELLRYEHLQQQLSAR